jgi:NADPH:quinone reductase
MRLAYAGPILRESAALADSDKLRPLLNNQRFSSGDIGAAHALVESSALGKVVVDF